MCGWLEKINRNINIENVEWSQSDKVKTGPKVFRALGIATTLS